MPVVLVTAEGKSSSGYTYDDRTGISYEYPLRYQGLIKSGEPFVYNISKLGYIGAGIVGQISNSETPGRLVCEILQYTLFDTPVSLRDPDGIYYEPNNALGQNKVYWAQGVRPISTRGYEQIIMSSPDENESLATGVSGYASHDVAVMVESISVKAAQEWLKTQYPSELVMVMPHNNPGYDIRVGESSSPIAFAEVKGTQSALPVFWLSEGERKFSEAHADKYIFIMVSGIDLKGTSSPVTTVRFGSLIDDDVILEASQWRGQLAEPQPAAS